MAKKRTKKYEKPFTLQPSVEWDDLMKVALEKQDHKKTVTKAKRAAGKKK